MRSQHTTRASLLLAVTAGALVAACANHPETASTPVAAGSTSSSRTTVVNTTDGKTTAELFRGKFPGVEVIEVPGRGIKVKIRHAGGMESMRNGDAGLQSGEPLYIVDGLPVSTVDGALAIDPGTILKIEVVDIASLAIYGIQGANGVVKITTKRK